MKNHPSQIFGLPEKLEIGEAETSSQKEENVVKAGDVETWNRKRIESVKEAKIRLFITSIVIILWVIWVLVALTKNLLTGDTFLIYSLSVPTSLVGFLLRYYFHR